MPVPAMLIREYDLIDPVVNSLTGGSDHVFRVTTGGGSFVLKQAGRPTDVELQARVAAFLTDRDIPQARILPTTNGALVTTDGFFLQELLPGAVVLHPDRQQVQSAMQHVGAFHRVLAEVDSGYSPDTDSLFQRVADPEYLVGNLPKLAGSLAGAEELAALDRLDQYRDRLAALPKQVVHGDIGPDNVLMDGNDVVAIIDFTPFLESVVFAACTALYWYHVYGQPAVDVDQLRASVHAIGSTRPWTGEELSLIPAGLLRESFRRLATPLALAAESGRQPGPSLPSRHRALLNVAHLAEFTRS